MFLFSSFNTTCFFFFYFYIKNHCYHLWENCFTCAIIIHNFYKNTSKSLNKLRGTLFFLKKKICSFTFKSKYHYGFSSQVGSTHLHQIPNHLRRLLIRYCLAQWIKSYLTNWMSLEYFGIRTTNGQRVVGKLDWLHRPCIYKMKIRKNIYEIENKFWFYQLISNYSMSSLKFVVCLFVWLWVCHKHLTTKTCSKSNEIFTVRFWH